MTKIDQVVRELSPVVADVLAADADWTLFPGAKDFLYDDAAEALVASELGCIELVTANLDTNLVRRRLVTLTNLLPDTEIRTAQPSKLTWTKGKLYSEALSNHPNAEKVAVIDDRWVAGVLAGKVAINKLLPDAEVTGTCIRRDDRGGDILADGLFRKIEHWMLPRTERVAPALVRTVFSEIDGRVPGGATSSLHRLS